MNRKLQVFISSTYEDLKDERQAAVQAVLDAGHIPAGMELFAAGDKSQWENITRWIDESDAFLLILGGRYGSVEPESKKAYVELEYRYAMEKGKRFFAVVLKEEVIQRKVAQLGTKATEQSDPRWRDFHSLVTSKQSSFAVDTKDIWIAIHKSLKEIERDESLGWVRAIKVPDPSEIQNEFADLVHFHFDYSAFIAEDPRGTGRINLLVAPFAAIHSPLMFSIVECALLEERRKQELARSKDMIGPQQLVPRKNKEFHVIFNLDKQERKSIEELLGTNGVADVVLSLIGRVDVDGKGECSWKQMTKPFVLRRS